MNISSSSSSALPVIPKVFGSTQFHETLQKIANTSEEAKLRLIIIRLVKIGFKFAANSSPTLDLLVYQFIEYGMKNQWLKSDDVILIQEIAKRTLKEKAKQNLEELSFVLAKSFFKTPLNQLPSNLKPKDKERESDSKLLFIEEDVVSEDGKASSEDKASDQEMKGETEKRGSTNEEGTFLQQEERKPFIDEYNEALNAVEQIQIEKLQYIIDPEILAWILALVNQDKSLDVFEKHLFLKKLLLSIKETFFLTLVKTDEAKIAEEDDLYLKMNPFFSKTQMYQIIYLSIPFLKGVDKCQSILAMKLLGGAVDEDFPEQLGDCILALGLNVSDAKQRLKILKEFLSVVGNGSASKTVEKETLRFKQIIASSKGLVFLKSFTILLIEKRIFGNPVDLFKYLITSYDRYSPTLLNQSLSNWIKLPKIDADELIAQCNLHFNHVYEAHMAAMLIGFTYSRHEWSTFTNHLFQELNNIPIAERARRAELSILSKELQISSLSERQFITRSLLRQVLSDSEEIEEGIEYLLKESFGFSMMGDPIFSEIELNMSQQIWSNYLDKIIDLLKRVPPSKRLKVMQIVIPLLRKSAIDVRMQMLQGLVSILNCQSKVKGISFNKEAKIDKNDQQDFFDFLLNLSLCLTKISSDQNRLKMINLICANKQKQAEKFDVKKWESTFIQWNHLFSTQSQKLLDLLEPVFEHPDSLGGRFQIWQRFTNDEEGRKFTDEFIQFAESDRKGKESSSIFYFILQKELDQLSCLSPLQRNELFQLLKPLLESAESIEWFFEIKMNFTNDARGKAYIEELIQFLVSDPNVEKTNAAFLIYQSVLKEEKGVLPFNDNPLGSTKSDKIASILAYLLMHDIKDISHISSSDIDHIDESLQAVLKDCTDEESVTVITLFNKIAKDKWDNTFCLLQDPAILALARNKETQELFLGLVYGFQTLDPNIRLLIELYGNHLNEIPAAFQSSFPLVLISLLNTGSPQILRKMLLGWRSFSVHLKNKIISDLQPFFTLERDVLQIAIMKIGLFKLEEKPPSDEIVTEMMGLFIHHLSCVLTNIPKEYHLEGAKICLILTANSDKYYYESMKSADSSKILSVIDSDKTFYKTIGRVLSLFSTHERFKILNLPELLGDQNNLSNWIKSIKEKHPSKAQELNKIMGQAELSIVDLSETEKIEEVAITPEQAAEKLKAVEILNKRVMLSLPGPQNSGLHQFMSTMFEKLDHDKITSFISLFWENQNLGMPLKVRLVEFSMKNDPLIFFSPVIQLIQHAPPETNLNGFFHFLVQLFMKEEDRCSPATCSARNATEALCLFMTTHSFDQIKNTLSSWLRAQPNVRERALRFAETWINPLEKLSYALLIHAYEPNSALFEWFTYFGKKSLKLPMVFTLVKFLKTAGEEERAHLMIKECSNEVGITPEEVYSFISSTLIVVEGCQTFDSLEKIIDMISELRPKPLATLISEAPFLLYGIQSDKERFALISLKYQSYLNEDLSPHLIKWANYFNFLSTFLLPAEIDLIKQIFVILKENSLSLFTENSAYFHDKSEISTLVQILKNAPKKVRLDILKVLIITRTLGIYHEAAASFLNCQSDQKGQLAHYILLLNNDKERIKKLFDRSAQSYLTALINEGIDLEKFYNVMNQEFLISDQIVDYLLKCPPNLKGQILQCIILLNNDVMGLNKLFDSTSQPFLTALINQRMNVEKILLFFRVIDPELISQSIPNGPIHLASMCKEMEQKDFPFLLPHLVNMLAIQPPEEGQGKLVKWNSIPEDYKKTILDRLSINYPKESVLFIAFELVEFIHSNKWEVFSPYLLEASQLMGLKSESWNIEKGALLWGLVQVFKNCLSVSHAKALISALKFVPSHRLKEFIDFITPITHNFPNQYFLLLPIVLFLNQHPTLPIKELLEGFGKYHFSSRKYFLEQLGSYFQEDTQAVLLYFPLFDPIANGDFFKEWTYHLNEALAMLPPHVAIPGELSPGEILILLFNNITSVAQYQAIAQLQYSFIDVSFKDKGGQEVLLNFLYSVFKEKSFSELELYAKEWGNILPVQRARIISELTLHLREAPLNALTITFEFIINRNKAFKLDSLLDDFIVQLKTASEANEKLIKKESESSNLVLASAKSILASFVLLQGFEDEKDLQMITKIVKSIKPEEKEELMVLLQQLFRGIDRADLGDLLNVLDQVKENPLLILKATLQLRIDDSNPSQNEILIRALSSIPIENLEKVHSFVKAEFPDVKEGYQLSSIVKNICLIPLKCFDDALGLLRAVTSSLPTPWLSTDVRESLLVLLSKHQNEDVYMGMLEALSHLLANSHNPSTVIERMEQWDTLHPTLQSKAYDALNLFGYFSNNRWDVLLSMIYTEPSVEEWNKFIENFSAALFSTNAPEHYLFWILMFKKAKSDECDLVLKELEILTSKFQAGSPRILNRIVSLPIYEDILDSGQRLRILREILIAVNHPQLHTSPEAVDPFISQIASLVTDIRSGPLRTELIKELAGHLPKEGKKDLIDHCVIGLTLVPHTHRASIVKNLIELLTPIAVASEREAVLFAIVDYVQIKRAEAIRYVASIQEGFPQKNLALLFYTLRDHFENLTINSQRHALQYITQIVSQFELKPDDAIFCRLISPHTRVDALQRLYTYIVHTGIKEELTPIIRYLFIIDESKHLSRKYLNTLIAEFSSFRFTPEYPEADYRLALLIEKNMQNFGLGFTEAFAKVATTAILIKGRSTIETRSKGQNPYHVFKCLKDSQATEKVQPLNATQVIRLSGNQRIFISLDSEKIRKITQKEQLNYGLLPENYRLQSFVDLLQTFNKRFNSLPLAEQQRIQGAIWKTCLGDSDCEKACRQAFETEKNSLQKINPQDQKLLIKAEAAATEVRRLYQSTTKENLELSLKSNFLIELISTFGSSEIPIENTKYYVHIILNSIYQQSNTLVVTPDEPESYLTPREQVLFKLAWQLIVCSTGQQDGLSQYYTHALHPKYKQKITVEGAQIEEFVGGTEKIEKCLNQIDLQQEIEQVCKDAPFLKRLIGIVSNGPVQQESHQTGWILNRLNKPFSLNHKVSFDAHSEQIYSSILNMPTQAIVLAVLVHIPVQTLIPIVQKTIIEGFKAAGNLEKADAQKALVSAKDKAKEAGAKVAEQIGKEGEEEAKSTKSSADRAVKKANVSLDEAEKKGRQKFYNALREYLAKGISKAEQEYNPQWDKKYCQIEYESFGQVTKPFSGLTELGALALLKSGGFISGWKIQ